MSENFTNFLIAVVSLVAVLVVGYILYLVMFVGPDNNGKRSSEVKKVRAEACDQESSTAAEVALCVIALEGL